MKINLSDKISVDLVDRPTIPNFDVTIVVTDPRTGETVTRAIKVPVAQSIFPSENYFAESYLLSAEYVANSMVCGIESELIPCPDCYEQMTE